MLTFVLWQHTQGTGVKALMLKKWFKPAAQHFTKDAFWDPRKECVKNQSNIMLAAALADDDTLYWRRIQTPLPPQNKKELKWIRNPWMTWCSLSRWQ